MDNSEKYHELRSRYPRFVYNAYHWQVTDEGLLLWFDFEMGDVEFHPEALIERRGFLNFNADKALIDGIVFNIGMVELVSYWKCACPPVVEVQCGTLTDKQIAFWRKLYWHGLGEFFYTNGISTNVEEFIEIVRGKLVAYSCVRPMCQPKAYTGVHHYLVPVGGGKDSVVTLELLRRAGMTIRPLIMNPRGATVECARVAGFPMDEVLVIRRTIDPRLLELNAQGYLNGHTPFSAMLAFYTMLASALSGIPNVALSNENSANESTVIGTSVNHQYSKSLEFEDDFREYCESGLAQANTQTIEQSSNQTFNYFSFLRPLSELQIAMLFSRFTQYHDVFRSCNVGSKQDIWCGHCAKCLFAYIILSPFIKPERLNAIFGKAMLDDISLEHEFLQLVGQAETKPFECVGTVSEVRQALAMAVARWYPETKPALLNLVSPESPTSLVKLDNLEPIGNLTAEERTIVGLALKQSSNNKVFREDQLKTLFAGRKILIAGYGREGRSTERLIKSLLPEADITIADGSDCIRDESARECYDMVIKSPGVPMRLMKGDQSKVTSQVDLFLQVYADMVVGITGTKGKSTTSSLISHLLPGSILAGNIGIPLFDIIDNLREGVTVVAELSCHQLEVLHRSPHVALILNLFQEHLDHYKDYMAYKMAKMQIALHQQSGDHFFYCTDNEELRELVEGGQLLFEGEKHPYSIDSITEEELRLLEACPLLGEHNRSNALVACRIASLVLRQPLSTLRTSLSTFQGLRHRLEYVPGDRRGVIWYNDSISTIPEATIAALQALAPIGTVMTLILGGFDRSIDYTPLVGYLREHPVRNLVFVGEAGRRILEEIRNSESEIQNYIVEDDYTKIVPWCAKHTHRRKICLLSPAAASYDSFRNFEARGDFYIEQIKKLPGND